MKNILTLRNLRQFIIGCCFGIAYVSQAYADEILIIANKSSNTISLSQSEVRQVYMGGTLSRRFEAVTLPLDDPYRQKFNVSVIGLTENRIQSYWAQLLFTGRSVRPTQLDSVEDVVQYVAKESDAIAYVPANTVLPSNVIVVFSR